MNLRSTKTSSRAPRTSGRRILCASVSLWLAFAVASVSAQPANPALQAVSFTVFSAKPIANLAFAPRANAAPQKTVFYPTARSPRYEFRGAMPIKFTDSTTNTVVAEATIPPEIRHALLLFSAVEPVPEKGLRYQVAVLDDSALAHAAGGLAIINLSGLTLSGTVGNQAVTLQPGLNAPLTVGRSAKIALRTTANKRTYQAYAETLQLAGRQRALLILFPPFYKGSLEVQSRLLIDETPAAAR
jgi:hypothetical protein